MYAPKNVFSSAVFSEKTSTTFDEAAKMVAFVIYKVGALPVHIYASRRKFKKQWTRLRKACKCISGISILPSWKGRTRISIIYNEDWKVIWHALSSWGLYVRKQCDIGDTGCIWRRSTHLLVAIHIHKLMLCGFCFVQHRVMPTTVKTYEIPHFLDIKEKQWKGALE